MNCCLIIMVYRKIWLEASKYPQVMTLFLHDLHPPADQENSLSMQRSIKSYVRYNIKVKKVLYNIIDCIFD